MAADSVVLTRQFNALLEAGDRALEEALSLLAEEELSDPQEELSAIRRRRGVTALALYDARGSPLSWVGVHRGVVPSEIRFAEAPYAFAGGPLFRYLYFTARDRGGGGTAMAAILLQANLPGGVEGGGFASRFLEETGRDIEIALPDRVTGSVIFDLGWEEEPLLSVALRDERTGGLWGARGRNLLMLAALAAFLSWGFLVMGGRGLAGHRLGSAVSLLAGAALFPLHDLWAGAGITSPARFLLALGPLELTLGRILILLLALGLLCGIFRPARLYRLPPLVTAVGLALSFPLLDALLRAGPSSTLLSRGVAGWIPYQGTLALLLSLVACMAFGSGGEREWKGMGRWLLPGSVFLALSLSLLGGHLARTGSGLPSWFLLTWGVPAYLAARGLDGTGRGRTALAWVLAAVLGSSAALPVAWGTQIEGRLQEGEALLKDLGGEPDPYLEFRLHRMAEVADSLDGIISSPVELLYETWAQSSRQGDPLPMWITLWDPSDLPRPDLAMGVRGTRPQVARNYLDVVRGLRNPLIRHLGSVDARYVLLVPLERDWVLSAVVPPRGLSSLSSPLGPIFAATDQPGFEPEGLIPAPPEREGVAEVRWEYRKEGWRGSWPLTFQEGTYLAREIVVLPGALHMVARGTLLLFLDLVLILLLWGMGRVLARGREMEAREPLRLMGSFRARVTLALFAFFLLSIAIFGTLAFQTLAASATRTAEALAERIVEDGAASYIQAAGSMELLAREVGADLLEYRNGELLGGSAEELVALGLFEGWIPEPVYRDLEEEGELAATHRSSLGGLDYVLAYRRMPDSDRDILATPVPVEVGATAVRRQEVADILGFAIILGAALSLGLALLVGRTLTRPMEILQVASERVGGGNLRVKLPEDRRDEFGSVFVAFNRMVLRIRRARRALLRTTRRTQAIVDEAATGVVALDPGGRVTLANPRAAALIDEEIRVGEPLPGREGAAGELVRWVDLYFRDGLREANTEFQLGHRRIRVRARRVSGDDTLGGAVLSLEDVTDELRSERILAWGEMARQVAHEVKNPLTPMKLSVQHLERAWEDRRPDFGEILGKNVEVILREIDHLAAIAKSFSRLGAPRAAGEAPLEPVDVYRVAEEVMNLYRGGKGALLFRCTVPGGLPPVRARESELREVLINLLENSRAAISQEGAVTVEGEEVTQGVEIKVRDDGKGIPAELLPRIFEPHFSTRSTGTGLGLAIVRRLVESWGGTVTAESEVGVGTVVRLTVPVWDGEGEKTPGEAGEKTREESMNRGEESWS